MKIKDKAKPKTPPVAPGTYAAVCVGVIDLGEQYIEKFSKYSNQVQIVWELANMTVEVDGEQKPRQLSRTFTMSTSKKSNLRAILSSWNGVQYSDEQFAELELFNQIGKPCMLNVTLNETGEYANIAAVIPMLAGYPVPQTATTPIRWDMDQWDDAVFETLPDWARDKIKNSTQYQKEHPLTGTIDIHTRGQTAHVTVPAPGGAGIPAAQNATTANSAPSSAPAAPCAVNPPVMNFTGTAASGAQPQTANQGGGNVPF